MQVAGMKPTARTYAGVFLVTLATLMFEVLLTRIFSVTMWYHFAFVAISVAMFGMSVGAIIVYLFQGYFLPERTKEQMARFAMSFALAVVGSFLAHASVPFIAETSLAGIASLVFTYVVISIPFVLSGICVCLALTRFPEYIGKVYAADLTGGALGCILLLYALDFTDAPSVVLLIALLASLAGLCFGYETPLRSLRQATWIYSALFLALACAQTALARNGHPLIHLMWSKGEHEVSPLLEKWNSFSRVRVYGDSQALSAPFGWGLSPASPSEPGVRQLSLDIDSDALTVLTHFDGDYKPLEYLKYDVTNLAHYLRPDGRVLVVGAGGGRDVLSALIFGQKSIVAVELNPNILKATNGKYGDFTGHLDRLPQVRFFNDEARSFVARSKEEFDIIQISMVDTWAATAAGAFVLSENSLYTTEAWKSFFQHLSPDGLLTVSRWSFGEQSGEVYRLVGLAAATLREQGIQDVPSHVLVIRRNGPRHLEGALVGVATLLLSRTPFSSESVNRIEDVSRRMGFDVLLSPKFALDSTFVDIAAGKQPQSSPGEIQLNLNPPTDDRPFFFLTLRPLDLWKAKAWHTPGLTFNLRAMFVLAILVTTVIALAVLCILVPLFLTASKIDLRGSFPLLVFFSAIGLGFMLVEISQMQRLMIFLGHPSYALSVVLFVLLISSGLGSLFIQLVDRTTVTRDVPALPLFVLVLVLLSFGFATPPSLRAFASATTPLRILVANTILFPIGFFMGMAFPLGMKAAAVRSSALAPWLWGINGATSVCASVLAMVIAVSAGISVSFWTGFFSYCIALLAFLAVKRANERAYAPEVHTVDDLVLSDRTTCQQ